MSGHNAGSRSDRSLLVGDGHRGGLTNRVVVIGDDNRSALAVIRSLGRAGKEVHAVPFDWHAPCLSSRYVTKVHRLPRYVESGDEWAQSLRKMLDRMRVDLIIPCCDRGILLLTSHREMFSDQRMALPKSGKAADVLLDKASTRALARTLEVPVARGRPLGKNEDASALAEELGFPIYLKPRRSYTLQQLGRRGTVQAAHTVEALEVAIAAIDDPELWLAEGHVEGVGVGYSILAWEGAVQHAFQHRRLQEAELGSSSLRISESLSPEMGIAVEKMVEALDLSGVCMFEFRRKADGSFILLEANPRFWGSVSLPISLGVDFPLFLYDMTVERRSHQKIDYEIGVRSRNLLHDGRNALRRLLQPGESGLASALLAVADCLAHPVVSGLLGRERSDSFVRNDMTPGWVELAQLLRRVRERRYLALPHPRDRRRRHRLATSGGPVDGSR